MAPKNIVISLDGATFSIVQNHLESGQLDTKTGLGLLAETGFLLPNTPAIASLTAASHIAIATGSTAANNDINTNFFHPVASPFESGISGFGAPIGGYEVFGPNGPSESEDPTAEPVWVRLREEGKTVVAATFPGADGADIRLPGLDPAPIVQSSDVRTVDYTVPFGTFGGIGAQGFSLDAADFTADSAQAVADLDRLGIDAFNVSVAELETIEGTSLRGGSTAADYSIQVAAVDTTDDSTVNYDELVVFDANVGIETEASLPATGSAFLSAEQTLSPFFFEGSNNKVGVAYIQTELAPDLSTVHLLRTSANYIPRNPAVIDTVDDINNNVGFWQPQPDFRIPERISPGFEDFSNLELEAAYQDLVRTFVDYQTDVFLRAIEQTPNADLALGYIEQPDGAQHQYLLTDPRQPTDFNDATTIGAGQDPAVVERFANYVLNAYETSSEAVQRVIDTVGVDENGVPNSNIIIASDHGFAPFHTAVSMNTILTNAGFDPNAVRAVTSGPAVNIYINVAGREPDGTVDPREYEALQQQVVDLLEGLQDTNPIYAPDGTSLFNQVYTRPVPDNPSAADIVNATSDVIGQDGGDIFAQLSLGYNFDGFRAEVPRLEDSAPAEGESFLSVPNFYGMHGYDSSLPEMQAIFLAAGPDFTADSLANIEGIRAIDIAPTLLDLMDVRPAETIDGESLLKLDFNGTVGADTFVGTDADEKILGNAGDDLMAGGLGNDMLYGENGDDVLRGDRNSRDPQIGIGGDDIIYGGNGNDRIGGKGGNDLLFGDDGDDLLFGDDGDDLLRGGLGNDILTGDDFSGGQGADTFVLAAGEGTDTIVDFEAGTDFIGLADGLSLGSLTFSSNAISLGDEVLAVLNGIDTTALTAASFLAV